MKRNNPLGDLLPETERGVNILLIQPYASRVGGVDTVLLHLIEALCCHGYHFVVAIPPRSPYVERYRALGAKVAELDLSVFSKVWTLSGILKPLLLLVPSIIHLARIIKQERIDLVHSHKINVLVGDLAARLAGVPAVHTIHEVSTGSLWPYRVFARLICGICSSIIVVCDASKELLSEGCRRKSTVRKIYNGLDVQRFDPSQAKRNLVRQELQIPTDEVIVTAMSRIQHSKGLEYFVDAAAIILKRFPSARFLIVGDVIAAEGPFLKYKSKLRAQVRRLGIEGRLRFTGVRQDVENILAATDVFVLPSVVDVLPTAVIEAMAMGKPVVATRVGGVPEIVVDGKTGFLAPPRDSAALAQKVVALLAAPGLRRQMGDAGRDRALSVFTSERYARETAAVYRAALHSSGREATVVPAMPGGATVAEKPIYSRALEPRKIERNGLGR